MKQRLGFTLGELIACVAALALVSMIVFSALLPRSGQLSEKSICASNLKSIGTAIALYKAGNRQLYPLFSDAMVKPSIPDAGYFKTDDFTPFQLRPGSATDYGNWGWAVEQNLFLLVTGGIISEKMLICPSSSTDAVTDRSVAGIKSMGFGGPANCSYGLHFPTRQFRGACGMGEAFPANGGEILSNADTENKAPLSDGMSGLVAIMADKGYYGKGRTDPKAPTNLEKRSPNHKGEGESVLFADSHVKFHRDDKNKIGAERNNIYQKDCNVEAATTEFDGTFTNKGWTEMPQYKNDSMIVWTVSD